MTFYGQDSNLFDEKDNVGQYVLVAIHDPDDDTKNYIRAIAENLEAIRIGARSWLRTLRINTMHRLVAQGTSPDMKSWGKETIEEWDDLVYRESLCAYEWNDEKEEYEEVWCPNTRDEFNSGWMDWEDYMHYVHEGFPEDEDE